MANAIVKRLEGLGVKSALYSVINEEQRIRSLTDKAIRTFSRPRQTIDISMDSINELVLRLDIILSGKDSLSVIWPSHRYAILIGKNTFLQNIGDFWLPSSDDIAAFNQQEEMVFGIDHEERLLLP